jgi:alcohol dehydrogenase class IV
MRQGANPWSDLGSREALRLGGKYLARAVNDASDAEAREQLMWAATLAGLAFGNAGVHLPHAMAYAVAGNVKDFRMPGYPDAPLVPHGISVVTCVPSALSFTAASCPERHLEAAAALGEEVRGAAPGDAGALLARALERTMRAANVPVGLAALGYAAADVPALVAGTIVQRRLLDNAPRDVGEPELRGVFTEAMEARR